MELSYARALVAAAPLCDLARAAVRRAGDVLLARGRPPPLPPRSAAAALRAAGGLARAPRLFPDGDLAPLYRALFPDGAARFARRARRILAREIDLFGRVVPLGAHIDWHLDRLTGRRWDASLPSERIDLAGGGDPKGAWEPARAGHLVELGAATRLWPALGGAARAEIEAQIASFLDDHRVGHGIHYVAPLEVALRAIHWLAAVELAGGAAVFPRGFIERMGASLLEQGFFLAARLEDRGVVPANHLLGDLVGLLTLGLALDVGCWVEIAARRLLVEAARQVGPDGAHFEASTAYHRFALELLLLAYLYARAAGRDLGLDVLLRRMLRFVRGYLMPDGSEPGFGDGDDARLMPLVPRPPRAHGYLLPIGAVLFGDPSLRLPGASLSEEALWLVGPDAHERWRALAPRPPPRSTSFPSGGVHVLRSRRLYVALRSGSYGQRGVGGHAHNDQLSLVVSAGRRPILVDPGTASYAGDPLLRDRFRGTAAHSTLVVDGAEQSPLFDGRPFALPDRARAPRVGLDELGAIARLRGEHHGYRRLGARLRHRRTLTLYRALDALVIEDQLAGRRAATVDVRFQLGAEPRLGAGAALRARAARLSAPLGALDLDGAVELGGSRPFAALVPLAPARVGAEARLRRGLFAPRYGVTYIGWVASWHARLTLPVTIRIVLLLIRQ
jgi:hypothetical protein